MASLQAHLITLVLRWQMKRKMRAETDVLRARAMLNSFAKAVPPDVTSTAGTLGGIEGEWLRPRQGPVAGTLLYLHGGGYFACSPQTHRPITTKFAQGGLAVFSPAYRLAPEHPFPAAVDDAVAAYRGLVASGIPPGKLTIAGDSAGGGLALAALVSLRDAGDPLPAAAMLFSPWTDLAGTGDSVRTNRVRDAMFPGTGMDRAAAPYLAGADPRHPLASPVYAELGGLPPLLLHVGSWEILLDDSRRVVDRARAAGTQAALETWPVVPHVWQLFPMPEAAQSMRKAVAFLCWALQPAA